VVWVDMIMGVEGSVIKGTLPFCWLRAWPETSRAAAARIPPSVAETSFWPVSRFL